MTVSFAYVHNYKNNISGYTIHILIPLRFCANIVVDKMK